MTGNIPRQHLRLLFAAAMAFGLLIVSLSALKANAAAPEVLTLVEAARLLRIDADQLVVLAAQNRIPARRIGPHWRFNRAALLAWLNGDWTQITGAVQQPPRNRASPDGTAPARPVAGLSLGSRGMAAVRAAGTGIAQAPAAPAKKPPSRNGEAPIGEAPGERTAEDVFLRDQKVLLAPGAVAVDVGLFFSRQDDRQLATIGAGVGLASVNQETFTTLVLARVGVANETELFASTSFRDQTTDTYFGSTKLSGRSTDEFGDIRVGLRRTLMMEGAGRPDIIATVEGRIPTGHSSYAVGGGLAVVKSVDPAVLFANANYRHTFSRDFSDITRLEAKERIDATMGYALALNDTLTISTSVSGVFAGGTSFDNATLRQQDSYSLQLSLTSWLARGLYIEPSVAFGLNGPGDSVAFGVTVPYTF